MSLGFELQTVKHVLNLAKLVFSGFHIQPRPGDFASKGGHIWAEESHVCFPG